MSDKRKDNKAILSTLQKELEDILLKAADAGQELDATRRRIVDAQVRASHEMLEHIEAINLLRGEIREMLNNLEGFEPEDMEAVQYMGEQLATAPLFHPQFEELLARRANAAGNGRSFDEQLREQVIERLDEFTFFPGQKENDARKMVLSNLTQADKLARAGELPTLARLLISEQPAGHLGEEAAISLFRKLQEGLKEYLKRIQHENKSLRNSSFGRHAFSTGPDEGIEDFLSLRELLEKTREAFADSIRLKGPSPLLENLIEEFELNEEEEEDYEDELLSAFLDDMLDESEGLMFSDDFGPDFFFQDEDEEEWVEVENPRFPIGSSVRVTADEVLSESFPDINILGWEGRVEEVLTNGEIVAYAVALDSHTLEKLPRRFIKFTCEEEYGTFSRFEFEESDLETAEPRDTLEEAIVTQRQLFHRYFWGNIKEDEQAARIYEIMLRAPAEDDISNWATYFSNDVAYPFAAVVEGLVLQHIEPGTEVEVLGMEGIDEENDFGLVASIKKGRAILSYPLMELMPVNDKDSKAQPLLDYRYWADLML